MGHKRRAHPEIAALATAQYGVVSSRQLQDRGFSRKLIASEAAAHRWHRIHRGVYAVGHEALTWEGRCMAAVHACAPAVASHWTAAWLWGLLQSRPSGSFHLTARNTRRRREEFVVHSAALTGEDVTAVKEHPLIPLTSLARTHLDLAAIAPERLPDFLESSEDRKLFDLRKFESLLGRTAGHPGHGPLQKAIDAFRPEPVVLRSRFERRFREFLRDSALPLPSHNIYIDRYELDCYWPEHRFCVELDTYGTHGSPRSFEEDRKRQRELRRLGIAVERVTDRQLAREPEAVLAAVRLGLGLG